MDTDDPLIGATTGLLRRAVQQDIPVVLFINLLFLFVTHISVYFLKLIISGGSD